MGRVASKLIWDPEGDSDDLISPLVVGPEVYRYRNRKTGRVFHSVTKALTEGERGHRRALQERINALVEENRELTRALARATKQVGRG
jgi:hypothetical protein